MQISFEDEEGHLSHDFQVLNSGDLRWVATFETTFSSPADLLLDWSQDTSLRNDLLRLICYYLVKQLPNQGLEEAAHEINEIRVFHTENPPALPAPRADRARAATMLSSRPRPQLTIEEE